MKNKIVEYTMITIGASLALIGIFWLGTALSITAIRVFNGADITLITGGSNIVVVFLIVYFLLAVLCCSVGFAVAYKLYKNETKIKKWAIFLIVSGTISLWGFGFITGLLFVIAGTKLLVKLARIEKC